MSRRINDFTTLFIVPLMILVVMLAGTTMSLLQHAAELLLLIILAIGIYSYRLTRAEIILLITFCFAQTGSFFVNDLSIFLLNAKQFGLGILSLIYFRRNAKGSVFLSAAVVVCIFLVFFESLTGAFPFDIRPILSTMRDSYGSRAIGLFLNYHYTSFFLGIFFVGYTIRRRAYFIDFLSLWFISVKTNVIGYALQKIFSFAQKRIKFLQSTKAVVLLAIGCIIFLITSVLAILELFKEYNYGYNSAYVVLTQFVDPRSYLQAFYIFPTDVVKYLGEVALFDYPELTDVSFSDHGSELSIVRFLVQGGVFLAASFLYNVFKNFTRFRVFIFISLFHYSFILSPLIVYVMSVYEFEGEHEMERELRLQQASI
ncbi:hypothetical protein GWC95_04135 [Sediminibacterium roseum]|uniref:Uncharacterized protein n=1 Tax=Sediminibacterium roseum TaxID=1978412 RepID=A0ABW9ZPT7_9BACT|nr:hypothetical protein [Sediminibacterium roseum]NCI49098.1 hypothetical protein [Sediminibacterium roseum]